MNGSESTFTPGSGSTAETTQGGFLGLGKVETGNRIISPTGDFDIKQFDAGKLGDMQGAVTTYINGVDNVLTQIKAVDIGAYDTAVFGSDQVQKIADYVKKSVDEIHVLTDFIGQFGKALERVEANYQAQNKSITTSEVASAAAAIGDDDLTGVSGFGG